MRQWMVTFVVCTVLSSPAPAAPVGWEEDAPLHAVQFVDRDEGWAVGDEGVVWHSIDGGRTWERQPTGVHASLRSLHFLNPYTGWIVGREELPSGAGSAGVVLFTQDGGLHWRCLSAKTLPGLNTVRFWSATCGIVAGDGSEVVPSGVLATADGGRSWTAVAGPRTPSWIGACFRDRASGVLGGAWERLGRSREGAIVPGEAELSGGRNVCGIAQSGDRVIAVGQGGLVLVSDSAGARWAPADLRLPTAVRTSWDLHAICCIGQQAWAVGRPGSAVLHSGDAGQTWEILRTGQRLPLHGVFFVDEKYGWAVGELGIVLKTEDGGRSWSVGRLGRQRAAVLFIHARATAVPLETIVNLGGEDGYVASVLRVNGPDAESAAPGRAAEEPRLRTAVRRSGGAAGEMLWQFPVPQHLARASTGELIKYWDQFHADRAAEELLRQVVLAVRIWRPSVVVTDWPDEGTAVCPADALVARVVREAFVRAADPAAFPEQLEPLGLEAWKVVKLYGDSADRRGAAVTLDGDEIGARFGLSARDGAATSVSLLADSPPALPAQRHFRLIEARLDGAARQRELMDGTSLAPGGTARRPYVKSPLPPEAAQAARLQRNLRAIVAAPLTRGQATEQVLAHLGSTVASMPGDQGATAALAVAQHYARQGHWRLAREAFLLAAQRYPSSPAAAEALRWLIRHDASSETRRRQEQGQLVAREIAQIETRPGAEREIAGPTDKPAATVRGAVQPVAARIVDELSDRAETRKAYQNTLELAAALEKLGPAYAADPSVQFAVQAARRQLGQFDAARDWYARFMTQAADGPWRDAAAAELWLANRFGPPPKPVAMCRAVSGRPYLDGKLDDACWEGVKPLVLKNAVGETSKDYATEAWLAYDSEFLYVALRCRHPAGKQLAPVRPRPRDADLRAFDRIDLLLDLDRDYATCFHLQVDQRGCVCEDCWGDRTWDPTWFVAVHSEPACWQIEAAIPLRELTGDPITAGKAWACNIVRVLPGRGVQAWSTPADVQPRPEGMGILMFTKDPPPASPARSQAQK